MFLRDSGAESTFDFNRAYEIHLKGNEPYWDRELMMLAADYRGADVDEYRSRKLEADLARIAAENATPMKLQQKEREKFRAIFKRMDEDGVGELTFAQLKAVSALC